MPDRGVCPEGRLGSAGKCSVMGAAMSRAVGVPGGHYLGLRGLGIVSVTLLDGSVACGMWHVCHKLAERLCI